MRLIDADKLLASVKKNAPYIHIILSAIVALAPTENAEFVHRGLWIVQDNTYTRYMCSECQSKNYGGHENYCPNCGAKMDLEVQQ